MGSHQKGKVRRISLCASSFQEAISPSATGVLLQQEEDDDDDLPFVSRPKKGKVMKVAAKDQKPTITTAGATSTYNELIDGDNEVEADDPVPETKLKGVSFLRAQQHRHLSSLVEVSHLQAHWAIE